MSSEVLRHPNPLLSGPGCRPIWISLDSCEMPGRLDELWAYKRPEGGFVVACLPFFARGVAFGDLLAAEPPDFLVSGIIERSGLRTLRACYVEPSHANARHGVLHAKLEALGLPNEWLGGGYVSILLRDYADQQAALSALSDELAARSMQYEVEPTPFAKT